jgi:hypothetical protein
VLDLDPFLADGVFSGYFWALALVHVELVGVLEAVFELEVGEHAVGAVEVAAAAGKDLALGSFGFALVFFGLEGGEGSFEGLADRLAVEEHGVEFVEEDVDDFVLFFSVADLQICLNRYHSWNFYLFN